MKIYKVEENGLEYDVEEYSDGAKWYYVNKKKHRESSAAVIIPGVVEIWYCNDKKHREDGPAVMFFDGTMEYWINGIRFELVEYEILQGIRARRQQREESCQK